MKLHLLWIKESQEVLDKNITEMENCPYWQMRQENRRS